MTTRVDPYRIDRESVPTTVAVGVLVASLGLAVAGRLAGVGQADTMQAFVLIFSSIVVESLERADEPSNPYLMMKW